MTPTPPADVGTLDAETTLRAALFDIRDTLAKARNVRDQQNAIIRAHIGEEATLARAVNVFDKANKKGKT